MIELLCQNGYTLEALVIFDDTIENMSTALQAGKLSREPVGVKHWAANYAWEVDYKLGTGEDPQEREGETARDKFRS